MRDLVRRQPGKCFVRKLRIGLGLREWKTLG
jgi:hypothetical protein